MQKKSLLEEIHPIAKIAILAGKKIMQVYEYTDFSGITEFKSDESPLTLADKAAHEIIAENLEKAYPEIPVLSEEGRHLPYEERKHWTQFWLVDPLDGTKEFIKRNGEFTVNIALIENNQALVGVIYAPVTGELYFGMKGKGAFKQLEGEPVQEIRVSGKNTSLVAVASRSHRSVEDEEVLKKFDIQSYTSIGSSLKFCLLAEGKADIYYRHGPTMEWDTAAGQAILEAAGGKMTDAAGQIFTYNKQILTNGSFLSVGF
jgi:3'(2'), 5'-bisphosphate nucleotidase